MQPKPCSNPKCPTPSTSVQHVCQNCQLVQYCSVRCRNHHWLSQHSAYCQMDPTQYTTLSLLGSGTYGKVLLVSKDDELFAMKIIPKGCFSDFSDSQLQREIAIHKTLKHPNIIRLLNHFQDRHSVQLLLEYAADGSLAAKQLSDFEIFHYAQQICQGLAYLHARNIIHRDLKPENILLSHGTIKLCDFGWSAELDRNNQRDTLCGTLEYMAPEVAQGPYTKKVDLWSLGVILYELYHNRLPKFPLQFECPQLAQDLIEKLLAPAELRLDIEQVLQHEYFGRISVNKIDLTQYQLDGVELFNELDNILDCTALKLSKRVTQRTSIKQPERKPTLFDRILRTLGCVNRQKK